MTPRLTENATPVAALTVAVVNDQFFAAAYQRGFRQTSRFLLSRGIPSDLVVDTAQSAWAKAWERREQLRNPAFLIAWVNSIALNVYRSALRREPATEELTEDRAPTIDWDGAAIDVHRVLGECQQNDRIVLEGHYILGYKLDEIAAQNNWTETAVRVRLLRARRRMKDLMDRPSRHVSKKSRAAKRPC